MNTVSDYRAIVMGFRWTIFCQNVHDNTPFCNWQAACSEWNVEAAHKGKWSSVQSPTSRSATEDSANWNQQPPKINLSIVNLTTFTWGNPPANCGIGHSGIFPQFSGWSSQKELLWGGSVSCWLRTIRLDINQTACFTCSLIIYYKSVLILGSTSK